MGVSSCLSYSYTPLSKQTNKRTKTPKGFGLPENEKSRIWEVWRESCHPPPLPVRAPVHVLSWPHAISGIKACLHYMTTKKVLPVPPPPPSSLTRPASSAPTAKLNGEQVGSWWVLFVGCVGREKWGLGYREAPCPPVPPRWDPKPPHFTWKGRPHPLLGPGPF